MSTCSAVPQWRWLTTRVVPPAMWTRERTPHGGGVPAKPSVVQGGCRDASHRLNVPLSPVSKTSALPRRASKQARDVAKPGTQPAPQTTGATQGHAQITHNCAHYRQAITRKSGAPIGRCAPRLQATAATLSDTALNDPPPTSIAEYGLPGAGDFATAGRHRPPLWCRAQLAGLGWLRPWRGCCPGQEFNARRSGRLGSGRPSGLARCRGGRRARAQLGGDAAALASAQARASAASSIATSAWSTAQAA